MCKTWKVNGFSAERENGEKFTNYKRRVFATEDISRNLNVFTMYFEAGFLCTVRDFGHEQGQVAAEMLQKAMSGTPLTELPITQNQFGQRILNKTVLKRSWELRLPARC
jgi:hypothetical protein